MTKVHCPECGGYRDECDCAVALRVHLPKCNCAKCLIERFVTKEGRLMDKSESKYPLIEKWLGLIIRNELMTAAYNTPMANAGYVTYVRADDLEAALQKGCVGKYLGRQECLTIYLPLKVQTKEERALAILSEIYASDVLPKYLDDQIGKLLEEK